MYSFAAWNMDVLSNLASKTRFYLTFNNEFYELLTWKLEFLL
jgi:hypothetical protein